MAQYNPIDIKRVEFDLSDIKVGESIFSKNFGNYTLCVRVSENKDEDGWNVYMYIEGRVITFLKTKNPNSVIFPDNEVFDKEKTKWVVEYWQETSSYIRKKIDFDEKLKHNFLY